MDSNLNSAKNISERLGKCYSGAVYDVLRMMGYINQVLPYDIRSLNIQHSIAGEVYTIEGRRTDEVNEYDSLLKWCELLSNAPRGKIIICQPNDATLAHMGELSAETLTYKGVEGYIVDGGARDTKFIEKINFPVFCKYRTPVDVVAKWCATSFGEAIKIGDVEIKTGDYVLADRDGIVIIPKDIIEVVVYKTEEVLQTENLVRKAILNGEDPVSAFKQYGKF